MPNQAKKSVLPELILGSSSPRRRDLLATLGLAFRVIKPETPEIPRPGEAPLAYVQRNALEKAEWVARAATQSGTSEGGSSLIVGGVIVLSADTIVVLADHILEKPRDPVHAAEMLSSLSGQTHTVISGVTILASPQVAGVGGRRKSFAVSTTVQMKPLSRAEIAAYIRTGEPLDKAGGYAAQGIGSYMVQSIVGSYSNVVGLPVAEVVESLGQDFNYPLWEV